MIRTVFGADRHAVRRHSSEIRIPSAAACRTAVCTVVRLTPARTAIWPTVVSTGSVGLGQRVEQAVKAAYQYGSFDHTKHSYMGSLASDVVSDFKRTGVPYTAHDGGYRFGALVAAPMEGCGELIEFDTHGFQPEFSGRQTPKRAFVSMGVGQTLADPFLAFVSRVLWRGTEPTVATGIVGV